MHALRRRLLVLAAGVFLSVSLRGQTLFNDDLATINNWIYFAQSSGQTPVGLVNGTLSVPRGQSAIAFFMPAGSQRTLGTNESLQVRFNLSFGSVGDSSVGLRLGLFDSNTTPQVPTRPPVGGSSSGFQGYDGYLVSWNPNPLTTNQNNNSILNNLRMRMRTPATASGELMSSFNSTNPSTSTYTTSDSALVSRGTDPSRQFFLTTSAYTATYSVSRGSGAALTFNLNVTDGASFNFGNTFTIASPSTYAFDAFAVYSVFTNGSDFFIDNVTITAVPEPSTYAACAGAAVLGLAFWRRRRAAAKALAA